MNKNDLYKKYNNLSIYILREIGRRVGVKSPTTIKKESLIKNIIEIKTGNQEPKFTKLGRKTKSCNINNDVINDYLNDTFNEKEIRLISHIYKICKSYLETNNKIT